MNFFYRFNLLIILFLLLQMFIGCSSENTPQITKEPHESQDSSLQEITLIDQWDTIRVLENPHKGWYHHLHDNMINRYAIENDSLFTSFPGMDHIYLRLAWSYLEPKEGKFNWKYIDDIVEKYVPQGYKISFRITSSETGGYPVAVGDELDGIQYATPSWVRKAGAKGTVVEKEHITTWEPTYGDPVYLEKLDQFHKAFAARYDGQPWVSYIDIGSVGSWGEGHTGYTTGIDPTYSEYKANMDVYLKNYKKSQLIVAYGYIFIGKTKEEEQRLYQYAISNGISLRCDSNLVKGYIQLYIKNWSHSHPHYYDPLYIQMPTVFELAHYSHVKTSGNWIGKNGRGIIPKYGYSGATIMRNAIKVMRATYIGYHGFVEEWLADNPDLTKELANFCGYWYFPMSASFPSLLNEGENELSIIWLNKGVAPAYNAFDIIFRFESKSTNYFFDVQVNSGNKTWLPETSKKEEYRIIIPSNAKKGDYIMKFRLVEQTNEKSVPIDIGIKESLIDSNDFVNLGEVQVK